jgi:hypothetical protein
MMINKNDRRGDSYLLVLYTCVPQLYDDNDEIPILWQVMMSEMAVVLVLRRSIYGTDTSICSYTAANKGGSIGSIWYQRQ